MASRALTGAALGSRRIRARCRASCRLGKPERRVRRGREHSQGYFSALAGSALHVELRAVSAARRGTVHRIRSIPRELEKRESRDRELIAPLDKSFKQRRLARSQTLGETYRGYAEVKTADLRTRQRQQGVESDGSCAGAAIAEPARRFGEMHRRTSRWQGCSATAISSSRFGSDRGGTADARHDRQASGDAGLSSMRKFRACNLKGGRSHGSGAFAVSAGSRRQGARSHEGAVHQEILGQFTSASRVRVHVPAGRERLLRSGAAGRPELLEYGATRSDPGEPVDVDRALRAVNYGWKQESLAHDAVKDSELGKDLYNSVRVLRAICRRCATTWKIPLQRSMLRLARSSVVS